MRQKKVWDGHSAFQLATQQHLLYWHTCPDDDPV